MSQYFAALFRRRPNDGWFRVGQYDATTVDIMTALAISTMFVYAASQSAFARLVFVPELVREFELWRLVTWPIVTPPNIFALIGLAFFWSFGQQLEGLMGRNKFLGWVLSVTIIPAVALTLLGAFVPDLDFFFTSLDSVEFGLGTLFLCGIWVYAATYPNVRWFEVIPLWAIAAVFTVLNLLQYTGSRAGGKVVFLLLSIAVALSAARSLGFATAWPIPHLPLGSGSSAGSSRRRKTSKPKKRPKRGEAGQRIVEGPWRGPTPDSMPAPPKGPPIHSPADQAELDALLDKIGAQGMESLTSAEKQRLNELSKRLRNR